MLHATNPNWTIPPILGGRHVTLEPLQAGHVDALLEAAADGAIKGPRWNVFWYGLADWDAIRFAVDHCRARPATLKG